MGCCKLGSPCIRGHSPRLQTIHVEVQWPVGWELAHCSATRSPVARMWPVRWPESRCHLVPLFSHPMFEWRWSHPLWGASVAPFLSGADWPCCIHGWKGSPWIAPISFSFVPGWCPGTSASPCSNWNFPGEVPLSEYKALVSGNIPVPAKYGQKSGTFTYLH